MSAPPCRFFQQGRCNAGRSCKFSHDPSVLKQAVATPPCRYFAAGYCAAGDACPYPHVGKDKKKAGAVGAAGGAAPPARSKELPVGYAIPAKQSRGGGGGGGGWTLHRDALGAGDEDLTYSMETLGVGEGGEGGEEARASYATLAQKNAPPALFFPEHVAAAAGGGAERGALRSEEERAYIARVKEQVAKSADKECGICLEVVVQGGGAEWGGQFGLLDGCDHVFCLGCIREWRSVNDLGKEVRRSCPLCRETSHLVVPSSYVPDSEASKEEVLATYRARLGQIDCRHFRNGDGECPFGTSCLYRHVYRDGTVQRYEPPRLRLNEEGELQAVGRVMLSDLIQAPR